MSLHVAVVNTAESGMADHEAAILSSAVATQVSRDFNPAWNLRASVRFIPTGHKVPPAVAPVYLKGRSDEAGALGYHDELVSGLPVGYVFADDDRRGGYDPGVTLSHEVLELILDPRIADAVYHEAGHGGEFHAKEACDACEADELGYVITLPDVAVVRVSDFVLPDYFDDSAPHRPGARYDFMGHVTAPFSLAAGGYQSVYVNGQWTQRTSSRETVEELHQRKGRVSRMRARMERGPSAGQ